MKMKTLKELKVGNDKSYKDALKKYYYEIAPGLINLVDEEEEQISAILGADSLKILETDSGNLIIKYMETEDSIGITGMISKRGMISARDLPDILKLYAMLIEKLEDGKTMFASVNSNSKKLVDGLIRRAKTKGVTINKTVLRRGSEPVPNPNNLSELKWDLIMLEM